MKKEELLGKLWEQYTKITPSAEKIHPSELSTRPSGRLRGLSDDKRGF